jgi:hypothetical protein
MAFIIIILQMATISITLRFGPFPTKHSLVHRAGLLHELGGGDQLQPERKVKKSSQLGGKIWCQAPGLNCHACSAIHYDSMMIP